MTIEQSKKMNLTFHLDKYRFDEINRSKLIDDNMHCHHSLKRMAILFFFIVDIIDDDDHHHQTIII